MNSRLLLGCIGLLLIASSCKNEEVELIRIEVDQDSQKKLDSLAELSFGKENIVEETKQYVFASVNEVNSNIRYKGDHLHHIDAGNESFRIKSKKHVYRDWKSFSLHRPERRNNLYEMLWQNVLKQEGLLFTDYDFVRLEYKQEDRGIYAIEEALDKNYGNHHGRIGAVLKFDERPFWRTDTVRASIHDYLKNVTVKCTKHVQKDTLKKYLKSWIDGDVKTSEIFNVDQVAKYLALTDVFNCEHSLVWINLRFFYDDDKKKIEMIGFDAETYGVISRLAIERSGVLEGNMNDEVLYRFFSDVELTKKYIEYLEFYSQESVMNQWKLKIDPLLERAQNIVDEQVPGIIYSWDHFEKNQENIRKLINELSIIHG